jgi:hypothetical protein
MSVTGFGYLSAIIRPKENVWLNNCKDSYKYIVTNKSQTITSGN